ncbi:hypothetical protein [Bacillus cereus]|uniref:hypothetical protein n=1 Tax=Bacillus cereus TaxID=1396 RepID=UPI000BF94240|nr:hypothetical protein [Bacillus cereus]PFC15968.1 hypothetical protein CN287_23145 [Bacillus cereus]
MDTVFLEIIQEDNRTVLRSGNYSVSDATVLLGCNKMRLIGFESEYETRDTVYLEGQGIPGQNRIQILVLPVSS